MPDSITPRAGDATPNLGLLKPTLYGDDDQWGQQINTNSDTLDSVISSLQTSDTAKVAKAGDTMTGPLVLPANPTTALQAAPKQYVDLQSVGSFNTRKGAVTLTAADITGAGGALLASPVFTGNPTAPTPPPGDADTSIATTAFVAAAVGSVPGGALIAPAAPAANPGALWWDSTAGQLYVRFDDGNSVAWVVANNLTGMTDLATAVASAQNNVGRNKLHNGLFNVAQRGVGPFNAAGYTLDRWTQNGNLDTFSVFRATLADADRTAIGDEAAAFCLQRTFTGNAGAAAFNSVTQYVEGVRRTSGRTALLSFWAIVPSGTPKVGINIWQSFGTGGSPSAGGWVTPTGASVTLSTTWARYTVTFVIPSVAGKTLGTNGDDSIGVSFAFSSGATNNAGYGNIGVQSGIVSLWGVQLEIAAPGQTAPTPLEKVDPRMDLANCQRFYQYGLVGMYGYSTAGSYIGGSINFPVQMRGTPTVTLPTPTYVNTSGFNVSFAAGVGFTWGVPITATGAGSVFGTFTASADL